MSITESNKTNNCIEKFLKRHLDTISYNCKVDNFVGSMAKRRTLKEFKIMDVSKDNYVWDTYIAGINDLILFYKIFQNLKYMEKNGLCVSRNWQEEIGGINQYIVDRMMEMIQGLNIDEYNINEVKYALKYLITDEDFNRDYVIRDENIKKIFNDTLQRMKNCNTNFEMGDFPLEQDV